MAKKFNHPHLLGIEGLTPDDINTILDLAEKYAEQNRSENKKDELLKGKTLINLFFENSTRTRTSFELAALRLGCDVVNMNIESSSIKKGETLIDTAMTLNAMHPDFIAVRHGESGAVHLLAEKVQCAVINAGDGYHEHPTQALLDALTIRKERGDIKGLKIAICGDIMHSRVARSNMLLLTMMGAEVNVVAPPTLVPKDIESYGVNVFNDIREGIKSCHVIMMLRLQKERMDSNFIPSEREYFHLYGLDRDKLSYAKLDAVVMHPGPINRGVEIAGSLADDIDRSLILEQVEMGVAVRQALLDLLSRNK